MSESDRSDQIPGRLVVRVGARHFAIDLACVDGVVIAPPVSPVPATPAALRGLVNHQGTILPAVDPDPSAPGERRHLVLLTTQGFGRMALLCDWVEDLGDPADAEPLDPDDLGATIVADYAAVEQRLPVTDVPTAYVVLRRGLPAPGRPLPSIGEPLNQSV